jgi:inner membrane protein involved in colicin E2 resistance
MSMNNFDFKLASYLLFFNAVLFILLPAIFAKNLLFGTVFIFLVILAVFLYKQGNKLE